MALGPGSIAFVGINTAGGPDDWVAFVALEDIAAGTTIHLSDNELATASATTFTTGESYTKWVAPAGGITAGTVVKLTNFDISGGPVANVGTASAVTFSGSTNRGFSQTADSLYAYLAASDATANTPVTHLARINIGNAEDGTAPAALAADQRITFTSGADSAIYTGPHSGQVDFAAFRALINDPANWSAVTGATVSTALDATTFTLMAPDPVLASISAVSAAKAEGTGAGSTGFDFTVSLSAAATTDTTVSLGFTGDASDFATIPTSVVIAAGQTSATVTFAVNADAAIEADEGFTVTATLAGVSKDASATILNDDVAPTNVIGGITILDEAASLAGHVGATASAAPVGTGSLQLVRIGSFKPATGIAESISYDATSGKFFSLDTSSGKVNVLTLGADGSLTLASTIDVSVEPSFGGANSIAVKNGVVAVAYANVAADQKGFVALYDAAGTRLATVTVGVGPDMVTFTPDGTKILVADEAEAISASSNPAGSVTIIDLSAGAASATVGTTIGFGALDGAEAALRAAGIAVFPGQSASADIEPEYISVSADGTRAYVTLQEVNAVAVIDLTDAAATKPLALLPLGSVDHSLAGNEFDASDKGTPAVNIASFDVNGLIQPDAIAAFSTAGRNYFVTGNEGDSRVGGLTDSLRLSSASYVLDPTAYPNAAALKADAALGRLNVLSKLGDTDGDGDIDQIYTLGGRGFSIFEQKADGTIVKVFESGGEFEKIIAAFDPTIFNQNQASGTTDTRSDDKGPEPEGVDIGVIGGKTYAFVNLERVGGVMVYDVTDPADAKYVGFRPATSIDHGPEVTKFVAASANATGVDLVVTANEVGGSTALYAALPSDYTQTVKIADATKTVTHAEGDAGTTAFTFTIERSGGTLGSLDFTLDLASTSADGSDFVGAAALPRSVSGTIAAGQASAIVTIEVAGDTVKEADEAFTLTLKTAALTITDTAGATVSGVTAAIDPAASVATGTITNDDFTHVYDIQGTGNLSPLVGQAVTTVGIVTAVDTNGSKGFWIQDAHGDGNAATSDGVFVYRPTGTLPTVGAYVEVKGTVAEFTPSGAYLNSLSLTEITSVTSVVDLGAAPTTITPVHIGGVGGLTPPAADLTAGVAFWESLEGMKVVIDTPTAVSPTNSYGEIYTAVEGATGLSDRGGLVVSGGASDFGNTNVAGGDFNPERIQIDIDTGVLPGAVDPQVNTGAQFSDIEGVVGYAFGNYEVMPTKTFTVTQASPLVKETTSLSGDATHLTIASYNAENLDPKAENVNLVANKSTSNVDDDLGTGKFDTIASQIFTTLKTPDIVSLQEIQDNDGAESSSVTSASVTLQTLADKINALATASGSSAHYSWVDNPFVVNGAVGGQPNGNIRTAFLYRDDRVSLVADSVKTIAADGSAVSVGETTDQATNIDNPFHGSRLPLVATFDFGGEVVTVINTHSTSKGGSGVLMGSDASPLNAGEVQRAGQAQAINTFVDGILAGDAQAKVVVSGDLNEFGFEEPMAVLRGEATVTGYDVATSDTIDATATYTVGGTAVLTDLADKLSVLEHSDYVFEGNSETLDHVLVSNSLASTAQFDVVRINADFADQTSDHDPLVARIQMSKPNFELQLLHFSDAEGGLLATDTAKNLAALVDAFDGTHANTLILEGGDNWIPGPFLAAGTDISVRDEINAATGSTMTGNIPIAAADIAIQNLIGVEASALGNHDFDLGSNVLASSLSANSGWVGANFVSVSTNLVTGAKSPYYTDPVATDSALNAITVDTLDFNVQAALNLAPTTTLIPEASTLKGKIAPSAVITKGGEKIGLVGATTQILEQISSPTGTEIAGFPGGGGANGEVDDMTRLAAQLQPVIDELIAEGVNKIILMAHLQLITNEISLASKLRGVDIIMSAGSHTRMGDTDDAAVAMPGHADTFLYDYPYVATGVDGGKTLIVNTDNEYTYLGRLVVEFDESGALVLDSLAANKSINGAIAATDENVAAAWGTTSDQLASTAFAAGTKGAQVASITNAIDEVITVKDGNVYGYSDVYLEGERGFVRSQETNLGDLSADANAFVVKASVGTMPLVSLKNGGGIRAQIGTLSAPDPVNGTVDKLPPEGGVSQLDVENSLRFDNKLMVFETTAAGLKTLLEHGAGLTNGGGFPQVGGLKFSFDPTKAAGSRVSDIVLIDADGKITALIADDGSVVSGAPAKIAVAILNFTANGGDGYPVKTMKDGSGAFLADNFRYILADGTLSAPIDRALDFTAAANVPANGMGEQKAFEIYMRAVHGTTETAFDEADTPAAQDQRIQNLTVKSDTVFDNPLVTGTTGNDKLVAGPFGNAIIDGGAGNDTITGGAGADKLTGGEGNDRLNGGLGADRMDGGAGDDAYTVDNVGDIVIEAGGAGIDYVNSSVTFTIGANVEKLYLIGTADIDGTGNELDNTLTGNVGANRLDGGLGNDTVFGGEGTDTVFGGEGNDRLDGGAGSDLVEGGLGNDLLLGRSGDDTLDGGDGDDRLEGDVGNDVLRGGGGNDTVYAGEGDDDLFGNEGDDTLIGSEGRDLLDGGDGVDRLDGGADADRINGGSGNDLLLGRDGDDTLDGGDGDDRLEGDIGDDLMNGGAGNDALYAGDGNDGLGGGDGNDFLSAGNGRDILNGGAGDDRMSGGAGADTFVFRGAFGSDRIYDFASEDTIDVSALGLASPAAVLALASQVGSNTVIDFGSGNKLTLNGVAKASLTADRFITSTSSTGPSTTTTPYLVSTDATVSFKSLLTAGDTVGGYKMAGIPDGLGAFDNGDGTFTLVMNHELGNTSGAVHAHGSKGAFVSSWVIDKTTLQVVSGHDLDTSVYTYDAATQAWVEHSAALGNGYSYGRFCSADLADAKAFWDAASGLGYDGGRLFFNGEETGVEGKAFAHVASGADAGKSYEVAAFGNMSYENALANPYSGAKTVVALNDDSTPGQVYFYVGDKKASGSILDKAGLTGGSLYGVHVDELAVTSNIEKNTALPLGADEQSTFTMYDFGDVSSKTGAQIEATGSANGVTSFLRPEDGAWDTVNPNRYYFVTTAAVNSTSRLWAMDFVDGSKPELGGTIKLLLNGTEGQQMFDNLTVSADGKLTLLEDVGNNALLGKVWQYDPATDGLSQIGVHDATRFLSGGANFLTQDEESSGVIDVSELLGAGAGEKYFLLDTQNHAASADPAVVEGGQLQLIHQYLV